MNAQAFINTATALVAGDKGLLAMDESHPTCHKRFAELRIPQTEEARRAWRGLIVTTPGLGESISGVILSGKTNGEGQGWSPMADAAAKRKTTVCATLCSPPHR